MKIKEAKAITGGLTYTTKMPGPSYNTPASRCITGARLRNVKNSVCSSCYALKGNYKRFPKVEEALERRFQSLKHQAWVPAMAALIQKHKYFRWHDAGDIQSMAHLENIFEVCRLTPDTRHWMPTREAQFLKDLDPDTIPTNLIIRMSSHMIDQDPVKFWPLDFYSHIRPQRQLPGTCSGQQMRRLSRMLGPHYTDCELWQALKNHV